MLRATHCSLRRYSLALGRRDCIRPLKIAPANGENDARREPGSPVGARERRVVKRSTSGFVLEDSAPVHQIALDEHRKLVEGVHLFPGQILVADCYIVATPIGVFILSG